MALHGIDGLLHGLRALRVRLFQALTMLQDTQTLSIGDQPPPESSENALRRNVANPVRTRANRTFGKPYIDITDSFTKAAAGG